MLPRDGILTGRDDGAGLADGGAAAFFDTFVATRFADRFAAFFALLVLVAAERFLLAVLFFFRAAIGDLCKISTAGTY